MCVCEREREMCVCVCVCVCAFVFYVLNIENMCIQRMCKRLGPARVRRSKYIIIILASEIHNYNYVSRKAIIMCT